MISFGEKTRTMVCIHKIWRDAPYGIGNRNILGF